MLLQSLITFLFYKSLFSLELLKYYDYPSGQKSHTIENIGNYYTISSEKFIYYANKEQKFKMKKLAVPPTIKSAFYTAPIHEIQAILVAGNSSKIAMISFSKTNFLKTLKTYKLKTEPNLHFVKIQMIKRIPEQSVFMASGGNSTIAKIDYVLNDINYITQYIDYVLALAVSPLNLYLTTSTTGLLCLSDWSKGEAYHLFSTKSYLDSSFHSRIDKVVFIDFLPHRQYFVFASTEENYIFFFDGVNRRIFNRLDGSSKVRCLAHVKNSSYLAVGSNDNAFYFISIDSQLNFYKNEVSANLVSFDGNQKLLILDNQRKFVVWALDERLCHYACEGCTKPLSDKHCVKCTEGYMKNEGGQCTSMCGQDMYFEDDACRRNCKLGSFERLPRQCGKCDSGCLTCIGSSSTECLSCRYELLLRERGECTEPGTCKKFNSIIDPSKTRCLKCFENCLDCKDMGSFNCTSCKSGHHYEYEEQTCTQQCFLREYYNYSVGLCMRCPPKCVKCQEMNICDLCEIGKKKIKGRCYDACPERTYELPFNGSCAPCKDVHCKRCPYNGRCSECFGGLILDEEKGTCGENCTRIGTFLKNDIKCVPCIHGCKRCSSRKECQECYKGYTYTQKKCMREGNIYLDLVTFAVGFFVTAIILFLMMIYCMNLKVRKKNYKKLQKKKSKLREKEKQMFLTAITNIAKTKKTFDSSSDEEGIGNRVPHMAKHTNPFSNLISMANRNKSPPKLKEEIIVSQDFGGGSIVEERFRRRKKEEDDNIESERMGINNGEKTVNEGTEDETRVKIRGPKGKMVISSTDDLKDKKALQESKIIRSIKIDEVGGESLEKVFTLGQSRFVKRKEDDEGNVRESSILESSLVNKIGRMNKGKNGLTVVRSKDFKRIDGKSEKSGQ